MNNYHRLSHFAKGTDIAWGRFQQLTKHRGKDNLDSIHLTTSHYLSTGHRVYIKQMFYTVT